MVRDPGNEQGIRRVGSVLIDATALGVLWIAVVLFRAGWHTAALPPLPADVVLPLGWIVVPLWLAVLALRGNDRTRGGRPAVGGLRDTAIGSGQALLAVLLLVFVARIEVNRTLLLGYALATVPVLSALVALRGPRGAHRVVILGAPGDRGPLREALGAQTAWDVQVLAEVSRADALADILAAHRVHEVFVAGSLPAEALIEAARVCDIQGLPLSLDATFVGMRTARASLLDLDGWTAITLAGTPDAHPGRLLKRALDVGIAAFLLLLTAPLLGVLALAIRAADGGPALFVQERIGRFGRPFRMPKLRTMVPDAAARWPGGKLATDPRVTPLGAWLRRLSLDELPQLVNVLRGEMSLVGPRPPLAPEVLRYERRHLRRLSVRPGMTGLWQVSGRADLPFDQGIALDLKYIDEWSLWLDVRVLARTVPAVVAGRGAR